MVPAHLIARKSKRVACVVGVSVIALLAGALLVFYKFHHGDHANKGEALPPTSSPTFDPGSTLQRVQKRGHF